MENLDSSVEKFKDHVERVGNLWGKIRGKIRITKFCRFFIWEKFVADFACYNSCMPKHIVDKRLGRDGSGQ